MGRKVVRGDDGHMETSATPPVVPSPAVPSGAVVVGVDGSEHADRAADWAAAHAAAAKRPLVLVHGSRTLGPSGTAWIAGSGADPTPMLEGLDAEGEAILEETRERLSSRYPDLDIHSVLERIDGESALLLHGGRAALVVVGSRGRGPVRSRVLGSVSLGVAEHVACPVVVVRPHHQGTVRRGVLVGSDGTETSLPVLEHAYRHASIHALPVTVLLTLWDRTAASITSHLLPDVEDEREQARLLLAETMSGLAEKFPDVHVETVVRRGDPADALVELAERMDLVVVGRHERRGLQRLMEGSTTAAVVERAHAPVAVVPVGPPA